MLDDHYHMYTSVLSLTSQLIIFRIWNRPRSTITKPRRSSKFCHIKKTDAPEKKKKKEELQFYTMIQTSKKHSKKKLLHSSTSLNASMHHNHSFNKKKKRNIQSWIRFSNFNPGCWTNGGKKIYSHLKLQTHLQAVNNFQNTQVDNERKCTTLHDKAHLSHTFATWSIHLLKESWLMNELSSCNHIV